MNNYAKWWNTINSEDVVKQIPTNRKNGIFAVKIWENILF